MVQKKEVNPKIYTLTELKNLVCLFVECVNQGADSLDTLETWKSKKIIFKN